jgi:hypothetical protein
MADPHVQMRLRHCNCGCGGEYPEACFREVKKNSDRCIYQNFSRKSIMCEQTARDDKKIANRWIVKARDTARRHAKRLGILSDEFIKRYSWDIRRIAHELEHAYGNGCSGPCGRSYLVMGHGLADITIDIVNPDLPPVYGVNTRIICCTCNRQKSNTSHRIYTIRQLGWSMWEQNNERRRLDPFHGLPLFARKN